MEHISKTLDRVQNGSPTNLTKLLLPQMPKKWVAALFKRFQARWLTKWTSSIDGIEAIACREWAEGLATLTPEHIKRGLAETLSDEWPPSMGEFRKACLGRRAGGDKHFCRTYGYNYSTELSKQKKLPAKNRTPTVVDSHEKHMMELRESLK